MRRQGGIARRVLNVAVTEIGLDRARVVAIVGELIAAGMAEHVVMCLDAQIGRAGRPLNDAKTRDEMIDRLRRKNQMAMDRVSATGEATGERADQTIPPPPQGVDPKPWGEVMNVRPILPSGQPIPPVNWAQAMKEIERYTKDAERKLLAMSAMEKVKRATSSG
jgi:hypothetical protein